ncbi:hypothetical protein E3N88_21457 [Mikania micrantha]|uniref:Chitin-binding type-1 domain-containing protein n=1 Tax=Mikania micrantha TaxID=192012 RepID=A0A5N6NKA0_9ASTR|nr:hypothetical protein E3N88_21457 [Mikania micrantha]
MNSILLLTFLYLIASVSAQTCGKQAGNALCSNGNCCSQYGYCGNTPAYCSPANKCQSRCASAATGGDVGSIITASVFDQMLKYRNDPRCPANGFYTYTAFINAAKMYNGFGTTGSDEVRRRELAAFFGQTSHETTGGWSSAPDGPYAWGYCFVREQNQADRYFGRGPIQLSHSAGGGGGRGQIKLHGVVEFVGVDAVDLGDFVIAVGGKAVEETVEEFDYGESELRRDDGVKVFDFDDINDSFAVMSNSNASMSLRKGSKVWVEDRDTAWVAGEITGFAGKHVQVVTEFGKQSAIWFWMTPQSNKPSSHDVVTGRWTPSAADRSAGRVSGYGVITNIINGGLECGQGRNDRVEDRIGFYRRYCSMLGVSPGDNLHCYNQRHF